MTTTGLTALLLLLSAFTASAQERFAAPLQPFESTDGHVHLSRPLMLRPRFDDKPLNSLMTGGWRLAWEGQPGPGKLVVRFVLPVVPDNGVSKTASEVLEVGESRDPDIVATCTTRDLVGPNGHALPDRTIGGVVYKAAANGDAGMNQAIRAIDLRAVVGGRCYAVDRFTVSESASDGDPKVTLTQAKGAAAIDAMLESLRITP